MTWERTYAQWRELPRAVVEGAASNALDLVWRQMVTRLRETLHSAGWSYADLNGRLAPTIDIRLTDDMATGNRLLLLAETRALQLLHPDPLPDLRPFPKLRRR